MPAAIRPTETHRDWPATVLSGMLAIAFAALFLSPVWLMNRPAASGVILGEEDSQPFRVTVRVFTPAFRQEFSVRPASGTLSEALSRAAAEADQEFSYGSRGDSIYVDNFFGLPNGGPGQWIIQHNGRTVNDLSATELLQGDTVVAEWLSAPRP